MADDKTPAEHASDAAEAIRALNHATFDGYEWPSDVDRVITELEILASRLPQAFRQAETWLTCHQDGIGTDDGSDPGRAVASLTVLLMAASAQAREMEETLRQAHNLTAKLTARE